MAETKRLHVPGHVKAVADDGTATFVFSVFGNIDQGKDVVVPGAFKSAIDSGRLPHFVADHSRSVFARLGKVMEMRETTEGAEVDVQFNMEKQIARDVHSDFKFAPVDQEFSFAYEVAKGGVEVKDGVRYLKDLSRIFDVGPVLVGMNDATRLVAVKSAAGDVAYVSDELLRDAKEGSELVESDAFDAEEKAGARNSATDLRRIQETHDHMKALGAACSPKGNSADDPHKGNVEDDPSDRVRELLTAYPA